ncbi:MAG: hypothetical protein ACR2P0_10790 [Acidimicrobiales bacterium]
MAWLYHAEPPSGILGLGLSWAAAHDATQLQLIVDDPDLAGGLASAAQHFESPRSSVFVAHERSLTLAVPVAPVIEPPPSCPDLAAELAQAGLEVVADHGVWIGEFNGLEVARVGSRDGSCSIDIGVGAYDQFASASINPDRPIDQAIAHVVGMVRPHRTAGSAPHPIGRLVRARWLRAQAVRDPELLGLDRLDPIPLTSPRPGLSESQPAAALGTRGDRTVLIVFTVGVDLAAPQTAAELAGLHKPDEVIVVAPTRDQHPRIEESLSALALPATLVALDGEWSD